MLAGRRLFEGKDDPAVVSSILDTHPEAVGKRRGDVPPALQKIVARALDKNVASRTGRQPSLLANFVACGAALSKTTPQDAELLRLGTQTDGQACGTVFLLAAS